VGDLLVGGSPDKDFVDREKYSFVCLGGLCFMVLELSFEVGRLGRAPTGIDRRSGARFE